MDLIFITNARLTRTEDGSIYGYHTSLSYQTFKHYLKAFDKVWIMARMEDVKGQEFRKDALINGEGVDVLPVPYFIGPKAYFTKSGEVRKVIRKYLERKDAAIICRVPGTLGRIAANMLKNEGRPFGVEVAGDPYDVFAPGSFKHPLRPFLRFHGLYYLRQTVRLASAALYVTEGTLQKRYPVAPGVFNTFASNVLLQGEAFATQPKQLEAKAQYKIASIGSLDQMYKAPDVLLKAIKILADGSLHVSLTWIGDGKFKNDMLALAKELGLEDRVHFAGVVKPAANVRALLDEADLFVLASRTEGLPRAMVEAMARGLPCIGTNIGGIPELLPQEVLVPISNETALAEKIKAVLTDTAYANKLADRNLKEAQKYDYDLLNKRRLKFYNTIKELTAKTPAL